MVERRRVGGSWQSAGALFAVIRFPPNALSLGAITPDYANFTIIYKIANVPSLRRRLIRGAGDPSSFANRSEGRSP